MNKFRLDSHKEAKHFGSTNIIVNAVNNAAKKLDLYSDKEEDFVYYYDCLADDHYEKANALIVAYELTYPKILLDRLAGRHVVALSKESAFCAIYAGYNPNLVHYVSLGVDSDTWRFTQKKYNKDKFVFLSFVESNTRSGLDILVPTFCETFRGQKGIQLLIKDREATPLFKQWVKEMAERYDVDIVHHDNHISNFEDQIKYYESADVHINLNRAHSWGMVALQGMSCGLLTVVPRYSGFSDYSLELNAICPRFTLSRVDNKVLNDLMSIGMKNHLIPITSDQYSVVPFWAETDKEDLKNIMLKLVNANKNVLSDYALLSRRTAEWFSWERTCVNYSYLVNEIKDDKPMNIVNRYGNESI